MEVLALISFVTEDIVALFDENTDFVAQEEP
jgi:hypothetical protein